MPRRKPNAKDLEAREVLAREMKDFRRDNLFTQKRLAEVLELSRRTIQMVEIGAITPHPATIQAFRDLAAKHKKAKEITIN